MHPRRSAQKVLLCDLCEAAPLHCHCELCDISLCRTCVGEHLSDSSKRHKVVPFLQRKSNSNYPKCPVHADKHCKHYCEKCDIPLCSTCVSSIKHEGHKLSDILEKLRAKTQNLQKDLEELKNRIYPRYKEMASDVQFQKAYLEQKYGKLAIAVDQQGEILHREITAIVNKRKSIIQDMKYKHFSTLNKNADDIKQKITELKQIMVFLKSILRSNDVSLTSTYKSRNSGFRILPPKVRFTLPSFLPQKINKDQLNEMFGSLSSLSINTEHGETMISPAFVSLPPVKPVKPPEAVSLPPVKPVKPPEAVSFPPVKPLRDRPRFTTTIDTGDRYLLSVSCLREDQVWICGTNKTMKLLNVQGKLLASIKTKSGNEPGDIAVTRGGDLAYTDPDNRTVNLVKNKQIHTVITLHGWTPRNIYSTASDDLLVTMCSDDEKISKVVRYSGSTATQTIQSDDQARPVYSSGYCKYISENRNLDICVADNRARAVVVVNQSGKLRFRYTGHPSNTLQSFDPVGITTDNQSRILTADCYNDCIHIIDQDGQFLRYICDLSRPWGLCVDVKDNLFVAECPTTKVKKIQYL